MLRTLVGDEAIKRADPGLIDNGVAYCAITAAIVSPSVSGSLILVRHALPDMADQRPGTWALAADGLDDARRLGLSLGDAVAGGAATVVCSTERKAIETAAALGFGDVHHDSRLREVERPWYGTEQSFRAAVRRYLTGAPIAGWEPLDDAVARFNSVVSGRAATCIVVSHGTVMSAWLGHQIPGLDAVSFWDQLQMPDAWLVDLNTETAHRITVHGPQ